MTKTVLDITMSLDGFIAGPGDDMEKLHGWLFNGDTPSAYSDAFSLSRESAKVFDQLIEGTGAMLAGRRTYDLADGWGGSHPFPRIPLFVVSREVPKHTAQGSTPFTFVTNGVESAVLQAKRAAGKKNVYVIGGANVAQQCLRTGHLDEMTIHLVPILLGGGIRLWDVRGDKHIELAQTGVVEAPEVTHLRYRIIQ
jgi:dihydrofolate reductase